MAFAALVSLMHTINRLGNPRIIGSAPEKLQSLCNTLKRLDSTYYRSIDKSNINVIDAEIRQAVVNLEDLLQSYKLNLTPHEEINGVVQGINSILATLKRLEINYNIELDNPLPMEEDDFVSPINKSAVLELSDQSERVKSQLQDIAHSVLTRLQKLVNCQLSKEEDAEVVSQVHVSDPNKSTTVELSDQSELIKSLLDETPGLKTISLVGMAGIGKTHLAAQVYQDSLIAKKFKFRAWVRLGQKDMIHNAMTDIVSQIQCKPINGYIKMNSFQLHKILQKSLFGKRYLIVLDDLWSDEMYTTLVHWLPATRKEIRILMTTRLQEVVDYSWRTCYNIHHMRFLNVEESWNLLHQNMFGDHPLYPQLEKVGKKIAEKCEGLPLLILAVANILAEHEKTEEYWNKVANNKTTTFPDAYDRISKVLFLSYDALPQHLKVCFLYMGVFPQGSEISLRKLVNLWSVEDFLEEGRYHLEDFSVECVVKIASNSLAIVCKRSSYSTIKSFRLHSAYWHLCVKQARENKFFHVFKDLTNTSMEDTISHRRFSIQNNVLLGMKVVYDSMAATSTTQSLLCTGPDHQYPVPICFDFLFLGVLDALAIRFYDFPNQLLKLVYLRYLGLTHYGELPSSIFNLWRLEYLILRQHHNIKWVRDSTCLPKEIWDMQELRHLEIMGSKLPNPSRNTELGPLGLMEFELPNLLTLYVNADSCTKKVFAMLPHLKKLGIKIELKPESGETISCLKYIGILYGLTSLKCVVVNPQLSYQVVALPKYSKNFLENLRKLCLNGLGYYWRHMSFFGLLPKLEVLKLRCCAFHGPRWETKVGEFPKLRYLLLEDMDLVQWTEGDDCFPSLKHLIVRYCFKLKEIPPVIGGNLKTIEVIDCNPSVEACVRKIQDKNSSLQVVIVSSWNLL